MIIPSKVLAISSTQAVDHAGLKIGHEELTITAIVSDIAERRPSVASAIQSDVGEFLCLESSIRADPVDRARP